mgnify:CR=1 FL=1
MREYVSQFREYLTEKKAVSENTLQSYMRDIQHFLTFMKEHQFTDLLKADDTMMHLYVEELTRQNLSNATITRRLASIRCFYQFLMQNYHITVNPAKHIKLEKSPKKLPHFLNGAEIDLLLAQPNIAEPKGCRDKAILELLYATGIRATELVELNLGDINLKSGLLRCKGKADRIIPVYPTAVKAVATYITRVRSVSLCDDDICKFKRQSSDAAGLLENCKRLCRTSKYYQGNYTSYAAPFFCLAFAGKWCGFKRYSNDDGTCGYLFYTSVCSAFGFSLQRGVS